METLKVGIVTSWFPAGAGYVSKSYQRILEKKFEVFIYARGGDTMKGDPNWDYENVTWAPLHYNGIRIRHFIRWAENNKLDIIIFNEQRFWEPVIAAKLAGFRIGAYIDYYTQLTVPAFEIYDFLLCNTLRHYSVFEWHHSSYYLPWGTDTDLYKPAELDERNTPIFLISAGWQPKYNGDRRGTLLALNAFKNVKGNCKLLLYSQVEYKACLPSWKHLIEGDDRIEYISGTFDPFPYNKCDVYLYPSRLDGIGLTLPEAISSGLAAITTNCGPMNEFVKNNYNGFLVDVEKYLGRTDGYYWAESIISESSLSQCIQKYIDDFNLVREHKRNSRNFALSNLNWSLNSERLFLILHDAMLSTKPLNESLISDLRRLDRVMSPTILQRIITALGYSFLNLKFIIRNLLRR